MEPIFLKANKLYLMQEDAELGVDLDQLLAQFGISKEDEAEQAALDDMILELQEKGLINDSSEIKKIRLVEVRIPIVVDITAVRELTAIHNRPELTGLIFYEIIFQKTFGTFL
jgi:hypothetical protein